MRLFLDANILFSAAHRADSPAADLFDLATAGRCELVSSSFAIGEARRNIALKSPARIQALEALAARVRACKEPAADLLIRALQLLPAKDAPILAAAAQSACQLLVTGDKTHFGALYGRDFEGVECVRLRTALERIMAQGSE